MGAARLQYRIVGKYTNGREVSAYHLSCSNGKSVRVSKEQLYYLVGRGQVTNADGQIYQDKVILKGIGENLDKIPSKKDTLVKKEETTSTISTHEPERVVRQPQERPAQPAPVAEQVAQPAVKAESVPQRKYKSKTTFKNQVQRLVGIERTLPLSFLRLCTNRQIQIIEYPFLAWIEESKKDKNLKHQMNGIMAYNKNGTEIVLDIKLKRFYDPSKGNDIGNTTDRFIGEITLEDGRTETLQFRTIGKTVSYGGSLFGYGAQKVATKQELDADATSVSIANQLIEFIQSL